MPTRGQTAALTCLHEHVHELVELQSEVDRVVRHRLVLEQRAEQPVLVVEQLLALGRVQLHDELVFLGLALDGHRGVLEDLLQHQSVVLLVLRLVRRLRLDVGDSQNGFQKLREVEPVFDVQRVVDRRDDQRVELLEVQVDLVFGRRDAEQLQEVHERLQRYELVFLKCIKLWL